MAQYPKILFMGTPEFAVASLDAIKNGDFNITGIVTSPDKPAGRGQKIRTSPVKEYALKHGLRVLQPEKMKNPQFLEELKDMSPDLIIVVAFRMLPEEVWRLPPLGTINLHASLLPHYRGAAPIHRAIMNGENETGVSTFFIEKDIDTGKIIMQRSTSISEDENAGSLHDRLKDIGAELMVETIQRVVSGNSIQIDQSVLAKNTGTLKTAPKIYPEDCNIDWNQSVSTVYNYIRGLSPHPAARTNISIGELSKTLKIFEAAKEELAPEGHLGSVITGNQQHLMIACRDGYIRLISLQLEGKKRMKVEDFINGIRDLSEIRVT
jgi:methionyl-tRNA formyltransferase